MSNRLSIEQSPYLLQHAENPVDWRPWGLEVLEEAKRIDTPIFLSIGYSTCHWCHVMAHESFEDETVAQAINAAFLPVKMDREERPDVDAVFMEACLATEQLSRRRPALTQTDKAKTTLKWGGFRCFRQPSPRRRFFRLAKELTLSDRVLICSLA